MTFTKAVYNWHRAGLLDCDDDTGSRFLQRDNPNNKKIGGNVGTKPPYFFLLFRRREESSRRLRNAMRILYI